MENTAPTKGIASEKLTWFLVLVNSVALPVYFFHRLDFLSNAFMAAIFDVIISLFVLYALLALIIPKTKHKLILGVFCIALVILYGGYWLLYHYMVGLASAFLNG